MGTILSRILTKNAPIKGRSANLIVMDDGVNLNHSFLTTIVINKEVLPRFVSGIRDRRFWYRVVDLTRAEQGLNYKMVLKLLPNAKT